MDRYLEPGRRRGVLALIALLACVLVAPARADEKKPEDGEKAKKAPKLDLAEFSRTRFERMKESTALQYDWETLLNFVAHAKGDVLEELIEAYLEPPARPEEQLANLVAAGIRHRFVTEIVKCGGTLNEETATRLVSFATVDCEDESRAWGAFNAFRALGGGGGVFVGRVKEQADTAPTPFLRAAAFEALGTLGDDGLLPFFASGLESALGEEDRSARATLVESIVWAYANTVARKKAASKPKYNPHRTPRRRPRSTPRKPTEPTVTVDDRDLLSPLVELLEKGPMSARTRRQVELALEHAVGIRGLFGKDEKWRRLFGAGAEIAKPEKKKRESRTVVVVPDVSFMGIETRGERIVFVLDASDSMLKPLRDVEREALRALIESDKRKAAESIAEAKRSGRSRTFVKRQEKLRGALDSDWDHVKTRFDAARAHLKFTLGQMEPETSFVVVLFGDGAELLKTTRRFVKAEDRTRMAVARELDSIKAGAKSSRFPYGKLRGKTNLYAALDYAFRVTTKGLDRKGNAYVNTDLFSKGADALFILSDGDPTVDGFGGHGPLFKGEGYWIGPITPSEYTVTDPETGAKRKVKIAGSPRRYVPPQKTKSKYDQGPYIRIEPLLDDIRRRNLYRRAVIHTVGIGEVDHELLRRIARAGHGQWVQIGEESLR